MTSSTPDPTARDEWAARAFLLATVGCFISPPFANAGEALALLAFCFVPSAWSRWRAAALSPLGLGACALCLVMALAMLWSEASWHERLSAWWAWRTMALLILGLALFDDEARRRRYARAVVAVLALACTASFVVRCLPDPIVLDDPGIVVRNHTTQGMAFILGAALALMLALDPLRGGTERRLLAVAVAGFVLNLALVTTGRSAHVGLLVAATVAGFGLARGRWRWALRLGVPLLTIAVLASSGLVRDRFAVAVAQMDAAAAGAVETSMGARRVIWTTTWELVKARPLLGYGTGGFPGAYAAQVAGRGDPALVRDVHDTHNQYLRLAVEAGLPGLLAFAGLVAGALVQPAAGAWRVGGLALLGAWLATSLFNSHFQVFSEGHMIAIGLGVLLALPGRAQVPAHVPAT